MEDLRVGMEVAVHGELNVRLADRMRALKVEVEAQELDDARFVALGSRRPTFEVLADGSDLGQGPATSYEVEVFLSARISAQTASGSREKITLEEFFGLLLRPESITKLDLEGLLLTEDPAAFLATEIEVALAPRR
jgi:hypothetical protein